MKKIGLKKQALMLTLVAALGVAVYLNYYFSDTGIAVDNKKPSGVLGEAIFVEDNGDTEGEDKENNSSVEVGGKVNYFEQARKNREDVRKEAMELIKDIAADVATDKTAAATAVEKVTALTAAMEREAKMESLIKAKGFGDCVVFIDGGNCSVVVKGDELTGAQTLQVSEIVTAQSDISAQNINIMAVNS